jgi:hypothetical protein
VTEATTTDISKRPLVERRYEGKPKPPKTPHTHHLREFLLVDGRRLLLDRRSIAFLCEAKEEEFNGKKVTIVAFKTPARACPVTTPYDELVAWWRADTPAANGKAAP